MNRLAALLLALAACDLGEVPANNVPGVDGATGDGSGSAALACVDRGTPGTAHLHATGGTANAGQACMVAGCHIAGGPGPVYGAMGTVYKADGTTPNPGAVLRIVYGAETKLAVADSAGNFTFSSTLAPTYPASTDSSACPTNPVHMISKLNTAADLNCNRAGCHDNATNRINFE